MTLLVALTIPGPPVPKARARTVRGHTYTPKKTREAEQRIGDFLKVKYPGLRPSTARLRVVARFYLKGIRGDSDNFLKLLMDGLNGRAFVDDKQVDSVSVEVQRYSPDPKTCVEIWEL
jgi:crossover junction endodeoxyribonuclease RusA